MTFVLALAGGVGGGKFARGLADVVQPDRLGIAVNTADDFVHLGLHVCPDIDSVLYAMADVNDPERGWGLAGETWNFMDALRRLGGESWFQLGDKDLATHVLRTQALASGRSLTEVTAQLAERLGLRHSVFPMTDSPVRTNVDTDQGVLPFQDYFVRRQCKPVFRGASFEGAAQAGPSAAFAAALDKADAVLIAPSNPYVSIDPILAVGDVRQRLVRSRAPKVAVSPIVGGGAVKGPLAKMMRELGREPSPAGVAAHYGRLFDGWVIDHADRAQQQALEQQGFRVRITNTLMITAADKARLAGETLDFARELAALR
jgi:LPPG:FO 2-phospho-L-lactate transferase